MDNVWTGRCWYDVVAMAKWPSINFVYTLRKYLFLPSSISSQISWIFTIFLISTVSQSIRILSVQISAIPVPHTPDYFRLATSARFIAVFQIAQPSEKSYFPLLVTPRTPPPYTSSELANGTKHIESSDDAFLVISVHACTPQRPLYASENIWSARRSGLAVRVCVLVCVWWEVERMVVWLDCMETGRYISSNWENCAESQRWWLCWTSVRGEMEVVRNGGRGVKIFWDTPEFSMQNLF